MTLPILRAGQLPPNGQPPDVAPMLVTCNFCGHQILVPGPVALIAAQQHDQHCIGKLVHAIGDKLNVLADMVGRLASSGED